MAKFTVGQKWTSETEAELGLGEVTSLEGRNLHLYFERTNEKRAYRIENAPLKRFHVPIGQKATFHGETHLVESYQEIDGLIHYQIPNGEFPENELEDKGGDSADLWSDILDVKIDDLESFELRQKAREMLHHMQSSPVQGLVGARIDLIPHQYYIAHSACAEARLPRRLLSDEVGLGKTIEAGLIYHKLKATNRIHRTLILIPEALKHQWMMEMYRRFHTIFTVIDDAYCEALEDLSENPFSTRNEIICDLDFILYNPERMQQVLEVGWDLLIVDEAHRIDPGEENDSVDYMFLYKISQRTPGLLLLTATPVQLQLQAHFSRLHLLDPAKFSSFSKWKEEHENYIELAQHLGPVLEKSKGQDFSWDQLWNALPESSPAYAEAKKLNLEDMKPEDVVRYLYDLMGTGRAVVRNTRQAIGGFPGRDLHAHALPYNEEYHKALMEFDADPEDQDTNDYRNNASLSLGKDWFLDDQARQLPELWAQDEKAAWLAELLSGKLKGKKTLVICASRETALSLQDLLQKLTRLDFVVFHEDIPVVARDRAAAWFADPEGADALICSEIGSEGRNFQFAHDMVLYDLPREAGLLEQRIGRLDRIGQTQTIQIHVPYVIGTPQERLFQWYNIGLNAFLKPLMGVEKVHEEFAEEQKNYVLNPQQDSEAFLNIFLPKVQGRSAELRSEIESGRDKLLEYNSFHAETAKNLTELVQSDEEESEAENFVMETLEHFGVDVDNGPVTGSWIAKPCDRMTIEEIPGLPEDGLTFTAERKVALVREDFQLFTMDNPLHHTCLDLILGRDQGRICFATCRKGLPKGLYLEMDYQLEMESDPKWNLQSKLAPRPIKVLINQKSQDCEKILEELPFLMLQDGEASGLERFIPFFLDYGDKLQDKAIELAMNKGQKLLDEIRQDCLRTTDSEIRRLKGFASSGLDGLIKRLHQLGFIRKDIEDALQTPTLRLEAIRIIHV